MSDPITPPSLIGAGVAQQPTPPQDMLGMLRSQGSMPAEAMSMMQAPQANVGLAAGSGMLAALGGAPGANPYLAQQAQGAQQGQQQQMQMLGLQQRKEAMDAERAMQQNKALLTVADGLLASDDPDKSQKGAVFMGQILKRMGADVPPDFIKSLGNKDLTGPSLAKVVGLYDEGLSPEKIAEVTGFSPMAVAKIKPIADSDMIRTAMKMGTRLEAKAKVRDDKKKSLELAYEEYGLTPKNPQTPFVAQYSVEHFGKPFNELDREQQKEAITKSRVMTSETPTTRIKNAMAEFNPQGDIQNPKDRQVALNLMRAKEQANMFTKGLVTGQVTGQGRAYFTELTRANQAIDRIATLDNLITDMDRLVEEGRKLGLTDNQQSINAIQQELVHLGGAPGSKGAEWYRAFDTLNARFATVAQAVEQVTGNRLAVSQTTRALGFHPKQTDPFTVQMRVIKELKRATQSQREVVSAGLARTRAQYESAAGAAGVPFIIGGHEAEGGSWSAQPEEE